MEIDKELLTGYVFAKLKEAPKLAKDNTRAGEKVFEHRQPYFKIKEYIDAFLSNQDIVYNRVLIMPGIRGVGKTTILYQLYNYLRDEKKIEQERILYLSADELKAFLGYRILDAVDTFISEVHETSPVYLDKKLFIMIDEAHYDKEWSFAGKILYDKSKNIFLIFTGSSALSIEMAVDAVRRVKKEIIFPVSFLEHINLKYNINEPPGLSESLRELIFRYSETSLKNGVKKENELKIKLLNAEKPLDKEWENFLCYGGFPFSLHISQEDVHEKIVSMIDRIIEKDVFESQSFSTETRNTISRILAFLALQKPGGTSDMKLAKRLGTSPTLIRNILDVLEKTRLIFSIKPYSSAGKIIRRPWKYYFSQPSISAAIRSRLGLYKVTDREMIGTLAEGLAGAYFLRMKETINEPSGMFYDVKESGVDFILQTPEGIIPVEVGIGKKRERQIKKAIYEYKAKYGVVISNDKEKISVNNNVIYIPITTFSFI
ncbi:hypothetical protein BEH94_00465 [Candidatus Altiarchaeales archaeon WOR_SM1_SCG]|nr:hypothetical protein BEH94_00465 [Candidatus Altiarchaeales archaeon WOR_SM1_SCG]